MYRVSPFVRHFAAALLSGASLATVWVNIDPDSYYDAIEWRLLDVSLPYWLHPLAISITPMILISHGLMALFIGFIGKELWEAVILERGALSRKNGIAPLAAVLGGALGAILAWVITSSLIETAAEASFGLGWQVPLGGDVVLAYVAARAVFGSGHPAVHVSLLLTIGFDILGLLTLGLADPQATLRLAWLALPFGVSIVVYRWFGRDPGPRATEARRRRGKSLWPYLTAGLLSWFGVAASGLPPALGFLPIIPAIAHADRSFGLFAEAEEFLHDPLNQLAHLLVRPLALVLFFFGITHGGIDLGAFAPTTLTVLAALWVGKPLGLMGGIFLAQRMTGTGFPKEIGKREVGLIALLAGIGFTVPILALDSALPGGGMAEAARLGLAISLLAGPAALLMAWANTR